MEKGKDLVAPDITEIMKILPHRYPFLLVDRVLELIPGEKLIGLKNVTINEPFFAGHFPGRPVMPGVLILEAMAQAAALLLFYCREDATAGEVIYLGGIDGVRFRRPVLPGDQLILEVSGVKRRGPVFRVDTQARVGKELAAEAQIMASSGKVTHKEEGP